MAYYEYLWTEDEGGNVEHIAEHGVTPEDFEFVFENYENEAVSASSGLPARFGYTEDRRYLMVVFEWIEKNLVVLPVTAFETPERSY